MCVCFFCGAAGARPGPTVGPDDLMKVQVPAAGCAEAGRPGAVESERRSKSLMTWRRSLKLPSATRTMKKEGLSVIGVQIS